MRIPTTHVGSLPRSQAVVDLLIKREQGEAYDRGEFDSVMAGAVSEIVKKQVDIDIVSDGETSKIGVVSAFQPNQDYPPHSAYVEAIGEAMRVEYESQSKGICSRRRSH